MKFEIEGPYPLNRREKLIDSDAAQREEYWRGVDKQAPGLPEACGCYIFAIQVPRGILPWYVGTVEKQSFRAACLTSYKIKHFNNALAGRKGRPVLFFLPQVTKGGAYRKPAAGDRNHPAIAELESVLTGMALRKNPDLQNSKGLRLVGDITVQGFINSRKARGGAAGLLHDMLI